MRYRDAVIKAKKLGACRMWLEVAKQFRSWDEFAMRHNREMASWVMRRMPRDVPDRILALCATHDPWTALYYDASLLDQHVLDACARKEPMAALMYAHKYLSKDTICWCCKKWCEKMAEKRVIP